jgi:flagellar hook-length control protein FliK
MNSLPIVNLPVSVVGQQSSASGCPQGQFADIVSGGTSLNVGENTDFAGAIDETSVLSQPKKSAAVSEAFSEKLKKALAAVVIPQTNEVCLNTNIDQTIPVQNDDAGIANITSIETLVSVSDNTSDTITNQAQDSSAENMSVIPAAVSADVLPVNGEENSMPVISGAEQELNVIKPIASEAGIQNTVKNYTDVVVDNNVKNNSVVEVVDKSADFVNIQSRQTETAKNSVPLPNTDLTKVSPEIKSDNSESMPQTDVLGQKTVVSQSQTNTDNQQQMPFGQGSSEKQNFGETAYQETVDVQKAEVSIADKSFDALGPITVGEIKTVGNTGEISSPMDVDLKTEIQQETSEISRQVADSIKSAIGSNEKEITIRLNPAELGKVVIKVSGENSQISTLIETSNYQTKSQLQDAFGQVTKNLADAGITLKQFEVRSIDQSSGFESAFSQGGQSGQNGQGGQSWSEQFFQNQQLTGGGFYYQNQNFGTKNSFSEQDFSQNYFTTRSVNMLA